MSLQIELLIFDLDGTLVDTRRDLTNSVNYARQQLGLSALDLFEVMQYVGDGVRKLLERSIPQTEQIEQALQHFQQHYAEHLLDFSTFYPGCLEVLRYFQDRKKAVISNKSEQYCRLILQGLEAEHNFELILGGDSLDELKPSPRPVLHVMQQLNASPKRTVMIGDSVSDIQAGQAAGAWTCAVTYGFRDRHTLSKSNPDLMIDDIRELQQILS